MGSVAGGPDSLPPSAVASHSAVAVASQHSGGIVVASQRLVVVAAVASQHTVVAIVVASQRSVVFTEHGNKPNNFQHTHFMSLFQPWLHSHSQTKLFETRSRQRFR